MGQDAIQTSSINMNDAEEREGGGQDQILHRWYSHSNHHKDASQELGQDFLLLSQRYNIYQVNLYELDGWLKAMDKSGLLWKFKV